ncbi:MAG TPA: hypothetical protein CFH82_03675 [Sulfurospirillum sp. UBA12182]|nr:MAG TPA: hypothetical protein CFH82_03675 [Sulfurospirillum sp. UBA12182]
MHNDLKDSIKARLYDMKYTPFLASYVFFFVYFNAKLFLIFFDPELATTCKIEMLSYDDVCHWKPIVGALFYTLIFPFFQIGFYSAKLWFDKKMNERKQAIEKQTLLSVEESIEIRYTAIKLQDELDEYIKKYEQTKKEYDDYKTRLETEYIDRSKELESSFEERVAKDTEKLKNELIEAQKKVADRGGEIEQLKKQVASLEIKVNQSPKYASAPSSEKPKSGLEKILSDAQNKQDNEFQRLIKSLEKDEKVMLKSFFETDSKMNKNSFKDLILKNNQMQKVTSEKAIQSLISKKIVLDQFGDVSLTELGLKVVDELFREGNNK